MALHIALVAMELPQGGTCRVGDHIEYDGAENWKLEPVDAELREAWEANAADPARVESERSRTPWTQREPSDQPQTYEYSVTRSAE